MTRSDRAGVTCHSSRKSRTACAECMDMPRQPLFSIAHHSPRHMAFVCAVSLMCRCLAPGIRLFSGSLSLDKLAADAYATAMVMDQREAPAHEAAPEEARGRRESGCRDHQIHEQENVPPMSRAKAPASTGDQAWPLTCARRRRSRPANSVWRFCQPGSRHLNAGSRPRSPPPASTSRDRYARGVAA
jgi:hypothetical protein